MKYSYGDVMVFCLQEIIEHSNNDKQQSVWLPIVMFFFLHMSDIWKNIFVYVFRICPFLLYLFFVYLHVFFEIGLSFFLRFLLFFFLFLFLRFAGPATAKFHVSLPRQILMPRPQPGCFYPPLHVPLSFSSDLKTLRAPSWDVGRRLAAALSPNPLPLHAWLNTCNLPLHLKRRRWRKRREIVIWKIW